MKCPNKTSTGGVLVNINSTVQKCELQELHNTQLININLRPVLPSERSSDTDSKTWNVSDGSVHKAS